MYRCNLILLGLIFNATWLSAQEPSQPQSPDETLRGMARQHIVYDRDGEHVYFAPEAVLQEQLPTNFTGLALPHANALSRLEGRIQRRKFSRLQEGKTNACSTDDGSTLSLIGQSPPNAPSLSEFLSGVALAVRGPVLDHVSGWRFQDGEIVTLVYIKVEEILACNVERDDSEARSVSIGDLVALEIMRGEFELDGEELCSRIDRGVVQPPAGNQVIAVGYPYKEDPYWLGYGWLLWLTHGRILPTHYEAFSQEGNARYLDWNKVHSQLSPVETCPTDLSGGE